MSEIVNFEPVIHLEARVGTKFVRGFDWTGYLSNVWTPNTAVAQGFAIRPSQPTGYEYAVSIAGTTGEAEPVWPVVVGQTVSDGSVTWKCQAIANDSLYSTLQSAGWLAPTGVLVSQQSVTGNIAQAMIDLTNALVNTEYVIECNALFTNGEVAVGTLKIWVNNG
ncbi:MAG: hypothetical protein KGL39_26740 [Patescibacteria group bacterium]|nr:hypothetical protein [Patescibacteria group bacterium]